MRMKNWLKKNGVLLFAVLFLLFAMAASQAKAETVLKRDAAWQQELLKERQQKDAEFKASDTSPMAGSARLTITALEKKFVNIQDGSVSIQSEAGAGAIFAVFFSQGKWYWNDAAPGVTCRLGEQAIAQNADALPAGSLFKAGRFTLAVYPGADTLALIIFDPQRPQLLAFEHLLYFTPDPAYVVQARLVKFPEQREVKIITTRKLEKTFYRYARIQFQLQGRELELTALKSSLEGPDANYLFIPFKDDSNGKESYEVGRFIDVPEPAGEEFVIDFNRCYNPLCNYSPAYNCPLPPLENVLDVAVPAGEKTYPH
jgi:uncharacterized protein (DUF1684 family)